MIQGKIKMFILRKKTNNWYDMLTCVTTKYLCFCVFDIRDNNSRFFQDLLLYNWTKICRLFDILRLSLSLRTFWNSEIFSNFKAHEQWWTVNKLCTRILRVPSLCPPIAHIHRWTLWKNHPSPVFSSKMKHKRQKHTHKRQDNGN